MDRRSKKFNEYRQWLDAAAHAEDGHYSSQAGISVGGLILLLLIVAWLF